MYAWPLMQWTILNRSDVLSDVAAHSEQGSLIGCDIEPRSVKSSTEH
jgi:hypothetical protein